MKYKYLPKLTKKEKLILELIYKYDFITSSNMKLLSKFPSNRHAILKSITEKGFANRHVISRKSSIWYLSEMGSDYMKSLFTYIDYRFSINDFESSMINHNRGLVDIELIYNDYKKDRSAMGKYFCEKEVVSIFNANKKTMKNEAISFFRIPDSMFKYTPSEFKDEINVVVELELTLKSKRRYYNIFYFYKYCTYVSRVYWVCSDKKLMNSLIEIFKDLYFDSLERVNLSENDNKYYMDRAKTMHFFIDQKKFLEGGFNESNQMVEFI